MKDPQGRWPFVVGLCDRKGEVENDLAVNPLVHLRLLRASLLRAYAESELPDTGA